MKIDRAPALSAISRRHSALSIRPPDGKGAVSPADRGWSLSHISTAQPGCGIYLGPGLLGLGLEYMLAGAPAIVCP